MDANVRWEDTPPEPLVDGILVAAFGGWNDAGEAATQAITALIDMTGARKVGSLDPENFYDFQVNRPQIRWDRDERVLRWPANELHVARRDDAPDLLLLHGVEPNVRWRTFVAAVLDVADRLGVRRVITLGALQVDVPHTRPVPLTGSASSDAVADEVGVGRSSYEGPTGIVGVLHQSAISRDVEAVTLWAGVPHYLAGTTYHVAALRIVEALAPQLDLAGARSPLREQAAEQLEARADMERPDATADPLPQLSGEQIAADIERFLRDRGRDAES